MQLKQPFKLCKQMKVKLKFVVLQLAAMTFTLQKLPKKLKTLSGFTIDYEPDFRQKIADSWPASIDDSFARKDWNWENDYDLENMTTEMFIKLKENVYN
jgi:nucleoside-diphosphate-sugar epimerase